MYKIIFTFFKLFGLLELSLTDLIYEGKNVDILDQSNEKFRRPFITNDEDGKPDDSLIVVEDHYNCSWCGNKDHESDQPRIKSTIKLYTIYLSPMECYTLNSPNYPEKYPKDIDYRYTFETTDPSGSITFYMARGGMQISPGCHRDRLAIVNSTHYDMKMCGYIGEITLNSGSILYARFYTNHRLQWKGFTSTVCASDFTTPALTTMKPTTIVTTPPTMFCDDICGNLTYFSDSSPSDRFAGGTIPDHNYPWGIIVDVFRETVIIRCSGYLISKHHVITSAYCFYQGTDMMGPNSTIVRLTAGETDLTAPESPSAQVEYTTIIHIAPDYDHTRSGRLNMAIITLGGNGFTLNENVIPICLHDTDTEFPSTVYSAGFGWNEYKNPELYLTQILMDHCNWTMPEDMHCMYSYKPYTPCYGDAGSALIYQQVIDRRYYSVGHINTLILKRCPLPNGIYPAVKLCFFKTFIDSISSPRMC